MAIRNFLYQTSDYLALLIIGFIPVLGWSFPYFTIRSF